MQTGQCLRSRMRSNAQMVDNSRHPRCRDRNIDYLYKRLSVGEDQIRVLALRPGRASKQRIFADLTVVNLPVRSRLAEHPGWRHNKATKSWTSSGGQFYRGDTQCLYSEANRYEALSYVWGDARSDCTIIVNGLPLPIGRNLYIALRRLRSRHRKKLLWVDAICINQRDDFEKSLQVAMMAEIYGRAWRTCCLLYTSPSPRDGLLSRMPSSA